MVAVTEDFMTYHDDLQPLPNFFLTLLALLDLLLQHADLISAPAGLGLGLLATQDSAPQSGISGLAVMSTGLDCGKGVELVDLIMD